MHKFEDACYHLSHLSFVVPWKWKVLGWLLRILENFKCNHLGFCSGFWIIFGFPLAYYQIAFYHCPFLICHSSFYSFTYLFLYVYSNETGISVTEISSLVNHWHSKPFIYQLINTIFWIIWTIVFFSFFFFFFKKKKKI